MTDDTSYFNANWVYTFPISTLASACHRFLSTFLIQINEPWRCILHSMHIFAERAAYHRTRFIMRDHFIRIRAKSILRLFPCNISQFLTNWTLQIITILKMCHQFIAFDTRWQCTTISCPACFHVIQNIFHHWTINIFAGLFLIFWLIDVIWRCFCAIRIFLLQLCVSMATKSSVYHHDQCGSHHTNLFVGEW